jgi:hypothetical protein
METHHKFQKYATMNIKHCAIIKYLKISRAWRERGCEALFHQNTKMLKVYDFLKIHIKNDPTMFSSQNDNFKMKKTN